MVCGRCRPTFSAALTGHRKHVRRTRQRASACRPDGFWQIAIGSAKNETLERRRAPDDSGALLFCAAVSLTEVALHQLPHGVPGQLRQKYAIDPFSPSVETGKDRMPTNSDEARPDRIREPHPNDRSYCPCQDVCAPKPPVPAHQEA